MTTDRHESEIIHLTPESGGEYIIGVVTTPEMIARGVAALEASAGKDAATVVENVYFAMRTAAGEGVPLRSTNPRRKNQ